MQDVTFIIIGATGDLARRYIIPAIFKLAKDNKIQNFAILGAARTPMTGSQLLQSAKPFTQNHSAEIWKKLEERTYYQTLDFTKKRDFVRFKEVLLEIERKHNLPGNRLFYLATLPEHFDTISVHLKQSGIAAETKNRWSRLVYEKPFGHDLSSAKKINACIARTFKERQIYRIDHYLGKELVGNIALIRFTNRILEPLWNNKHIESVQIILSEKVGLENRAKYYDHYGAIKDMVQSHMLQIMALLGMEEPSKLTGDYIRNEKVKVLKKIKVKDILVGQYEGYTREQGVRPLSTTETFAALRLEIKNPRWRGVPFYLKTGKYLKGKESVIHIKFKMVECLLTKNCPSDSNYLTIRIYPNEGIVFEMNAKAPGETYQVVPVKMEFCHSCLYGPNTPEAYENLLQQVLLGDQSVFVRRDEIEQAWKIVDLIKKGTLYPYAKGSSGPEELKKWKVRWRS